MVITGDRAHPALLALFSIVTVVAHQQLQHPFELQKQLGIGRHYRRLPMR